MPDSHDAMPRIAAFTSANRWRGTAFLRFGSFLSLWGVTYASLLASAAWDKLPAALAASALTTALGSGALYSPLLAGLTARSPGETGRPLAVPGRGASWTGGVVAAMGMGVLAGLAAGLAAGRGSALALLPALALGLNAAYLPAKAACLLQGCCRAHGAAAPRWLAGFPGELPGLELCLTLATLSACWLTGAASPGMLAALGFLGHGVTRFLGIRIRGHALWRPLRDPGLELPALGLAALISLIAI